MSETNPNPSGVEQASGQEDNSQKEQDQFVKYENYEKVLKQRKKDQVRVRELEAEINAFKAEREAAEETALKEQNKFKELYEKEQQKAQELSDQFSGLRQEIQLTTKRNALKSELGGVQQEEYLQFANLDGIEVLEDGTINLDTVKAVAAEYREKHSHLLKVATPPPSNDSQEQDISSGKLHYDKWMTLSYKERMAKEHLVDPGTIPLD